MRSPQGSVKISHINTSTGHPAGVLEGLDDINQMYRSWLEFDNLGVSKDIGVPIPVTTRVSQRQRAELL